MQSCCLEGCESYKFMNRQKIGYYKFPINNKPLLDKWLSQIRIPNWIPQDCHQICSTHFHVDDIDFSGKQPRLKENAIPLIFPLKHFQNIYVNELASVGDSQKAKSDPKSLKKQAIACKKKMDLMDCKNNLGDGQKSMILLCTPTEQLITSPRIQINSKGQTNAKVKNILLETEQNSKSGVDPYILIVSEETESKIAFTQSPKPKQAVLRIQIEKKVNNVPCDFVIANDVEKKTIQSSESNTTNKEKSDESNGLEEIEIDDVTSTKKVTFKFDLSTGKITVQKRDKLTNNIIDASEKKSNNKIIDSSSNNYANENNKYIETSCQNSQGIAIEETSTLNSASSENEISSQEEIIKKTQNLSETIKEQISAVNKTVESQKVTTKEKQYSTTCIESSNPIVNRTTELQPSVQTDESLKLIRKTIRLKGSTLNIASEIPLKQSTNDLQSSAQNFLSQKSVIESETSTVNNEYSIKDSVTDAQNTSSTVELSKSCAKRLTKDLQISETDYASNTLTKKVAIEQQSSTPIEESKVPTNNSATEQLTPISVVEIKSLAKTPTKEHLMSTPTGQSKISVKKLARDPQTPIITVVSKTKSHTSSSVANLQRTTMKPTKIQNSVTIKKDTNAITKKQTPKVKANDFSNKRKSDVIIINTSEDEDERSVTNNKKLKPNCNTVILQDQAVITIIE